MADSPASSDSSNLKTQIAWVDGAGGYQWVDQDEVSLGRYDCHINLIADVGREAGVLRRQGEDWIWNPSMSKSPQEAGSKIENERWLQTPGAFQMGRSTTCVWERPNPLSQTHRLSVTPPHRFVEPIDAALLVSGLVVIGPTDDCHIVVRHADNKATLQKKRGKIVIRHQGTTIPLESNQAIRSGWLSIQLEEKCSVA